MTPGFRLFVVAVVLVTVLAIVAEASLS